MVHCALIDICDIWCLQVGGRVGLPEAGLMLDIAAHRPDIGAVLQEATAEAAEIGGGSDVGVYVAGRQQC